MRYEEDQTGRLANGLEVAGVYALFAPGSAIVCGDLGHSAKSVAIALRNYGAIVVKRPSVGRRQKKAST